MARKILLADDSVTAQNMGRKILADAGYEVVTVNNGSAALKKIAEIKPDLVILDVYMPGYSGLEVCQRLKESQDSSRIPVLLSVGKLEPFKPEEAQRVRADAFIVKPFEASELLSALSKLEDKVVPRAEPSKPGRFARAMASAEETSRGPRDEFTGGEDTGWKSRIAFPHAKTEAEKAEPEEKAADDAAIYNPVNRDLRTVVETAAEKQKEEKKAESQPQTERVAEPVVDVAAFAPVGLPQDVTPEEVAAIAAAVAQMQTAQAALNEEPIPSAASLAAPPEPPPVSMSVVEQAVVAQVEEKASQELPPQAEEPQDAPVTMAAANAEVAMSASTEPVPSAPPAAQWTAVAVALDATDAAVSLDQEMQKAYAAFVAEETVAAERQAEPTSPQNPAAPAETPVEEVSVAAPNPEPVPAVAASVPEPEPEPESKSIEMPEAAATAFVSAEPAASIEQAVAIPEPEAELPAPAAVEIAPVEAMIEPAAAQQIGAPLPEPTPEPLPEPMTAVAESATPVVETVPEALVAVPQDLQPALEASPAALAAAPSTSAFASFVPVVEQKAEQKAERKEEAYIQEDRHEPEQHEDPEVVKSTAAAWASWRQIRDTGEAKAVATQPSHREFDVPAPQPAESAAMAVAAGAELAQEIPDQSPKSPADVASIVDSVLADLRPKLMAEISRKMSEKK